MKQLKRLGTWYNSKTGRQRNVLRITAFLLSALPVVGWLGVAPWMVPLMLYLEFNLGQDIES